MTGDGKEKQADQRPTHRRRAPKLITPERLNNIALYYLQRFASSSENLRRVLRRRVFKSARYHGTDPDEAAPWIDDIVERYTRAGLLDDRAYAKARAEALARRGNSLRSIRAKLSAKGVAAENIDAAVAALADELGDTEEAAEAAAAWAYARRRRIGPFRAEDERAEQRQRDLAAMSRAGFGYDTALAVVDGDREDIV